jgi:hypothetical protein
VDTIKVALTVVESTLRALLTVRGWRGTVRLTLHIDADAKSIRVVPEVIPVV